MGGAPLPVGVFLCYVFAVQSMPRAQQNWCAHRTKVTWWQLYILFAKAGCSFPCISIKEKKVRIQPNFRAIAVAQ